MNTNAEQSQPMLMTRHQAISARALARAFGHFWADLALESLNPNEIAAASREAVEGGALGGIDCPVWDKGVPGSLSHQTLSGRVRWMIDFRGDVLITVCRPTGPVLLAEVWGSIGCGQCISVYRAAESQVCARHVQALWEVAQALGVTKSEFRRVWDKFPAAAAEQAEHESAATA